MKTLFSITFPLTSREGGGRQEELLCDHIARSKDERVLKPELQGSWTPGLHFGSQSNGTHGNSAELPQCLVRGFSKHFKHLQVFCTLDSAMPSIKSEAQRLPTILRFPCCLQAEQKALPKDSGTCLDFTVYHQEEKICTC